VSSVNRQFGKGMATATYVPTMIDNFVRKPLSFHSVSFGEDASSTTLRRMADIALEIQNNAPRGVVLPAAANVPSYFTTALDTVSTPAFGVDMLQNNNDLSQVRLTETFLGIAESLRKPRGSLMH
jgi:hypothetical protein